MPSRRQGRRRRQTANRVHPTRAAAVPWRERHPAAQVRLPRKAGCGGTRQRLGRGHGSSRPCSAEGACGGGSWRGILVATPVPQLPLHKGFSPEGRAKHNEPLALWWQGPSPDPNISGRARVWLERSKVGRLLRRGVPDAGLDLVELDPSMIPEGICEVAMKGGDTLGRTDDIGIVEKRKHALAWLQCGRNGVKGGVLGDCVECRHQGVALLPALGLQDLVFRADIVGPDIAALGAVELASEQQERG